MDELALEKTMTVREVAEALNVSRQTIYRAMEEAGLSDLSKNGQVTYLTEMQVTAIKLNLRKNLEVASQPKTRLEKALLIQQALEYQQDIITELEKENAEQKERLAISEPKAETLDKIAATSNDVSVRELASVLAVPHLGRNNLFERLRQDGYIDGYNHPYRKYIEAGLMYEKEYYVPQIDRTNLQLRITQKGVTYFAQRYGQVPRPKIRYGITESNNATT